VFADGFEVRFRSCSADDEEVTELREAAQVEDGDLGRLLLIGEATAGAGEFGSDDLIGGIW
jgi:hypothetical protein